MVSSRPCRSLATALLTATLGVAGGTGCAAGVSLSAAANLDVNGHFGTEERLQGFAAAGAPSFRFVTALSGGAGYLGGARAGFATISPEVGVEGGRDVQWSAMAFYAPRFLFQGSAGVSQGGGSAGQVLFRLRRTGGEDGSLLVGPRLSIEVADVNPAVPEGKASVVLFQLGVVLRWTTFDTTEKSWSN